MNDHPSEPLEGDSLDKLNNIDLSHSPDNWSDWFSYISLKFVLYVAKSPWEFLTSILIILTPLMIICAYCSYKLAKELKRQEVDKKRKAKLTPAINKSRKQVKFVLYVAKSPWEFLTSILIILTPLMIICAYCSYKLAKELKRQEVDQKMKAKRTAAINKSRKQVKVD
uniref:Small integral membrane protein 15 n=1 Tax=Schistosoma haematobium TaxID=6185 RepID=A0A095CGR3_SCHHA